MPDSVPRLAPEVGADIRSAQDRLLRAQREMEVTGDASSHLYGALASGLGAMYRLSVDTGLMMQTCQAEMAKYRLGDGDTETVTERVARAATSKLPWAIDRLVAQRVWRLALLATGVLIGTNLLTAGGMYLGLRATLDFTRRAPGRIGGGALAQPDRGQPRRSGQPGTWPVQSSTRRRHSLRVLLVDDPTSTTEGGMSRQQQPPGGIIQSGPGMGRNPRLGTASRPSGYPDEHSAAGRSNSLRNANHHAMRSFTGSASPMPIIS
jgi:hypothetical protein